MKQAIHLAVIITALTTYSLPGYSRPGLPKKDAENMIGYYDDSTTVVTIPSLDKMLEEIMNLTGLKASFELKEAKVMNIEAYISHRKRYILYNPEFIARINAAAKNKWAVLTLLAHEVGHHLNGHTIRKSGSTPSLELEADEFAGFVLNKLGATPQQSQEVMKYIATTEGSSTHPGRESRIRAIQIGWDKAAAESGVIIAKN